jgi:signal transduction histidine kinase
VFGNYQVGVVTFVLWIGLYTVASRRPTRRLIEAVVGSYVGVAIIAWSKPPDLNVPGAVLIGFILTASALAGYVVRHDHQRRANELTEHQNAADAQARRMQLVIATERLRIADELSTIITRSIHTIAQEAGTGSQLIDSNPIAARTTLETISTISRDALNDLRRLLKHMRAESEPTMYSPLASTVDASSTSGAR